jgi:hypothetical protein
LAGLGWKRSWRMAMAKSDIMVPIPMKRCIWRSTQVNSCSDVSSVDSMIIEFHQACECHVHVTRPPCLILQILFLCSMLPRVLVFFSMRLPHPSPSQPLPPQYCRSLVSNFMISQGTKTDVWKGSALQLNASRLEQGFGTVPTNT